MPYSLFNERKSFPEFSTVHRYYVHYYEEGKKDQELLANIEILENSRPSIIYYHNHLYQIHASLLKVPYMYHFISGQCLVTKILSLKQTLLRLFWALSKLGLNIWTSVFVPALSNVNENPAELVQPESPSSVTPRWGQITLACLHNWFPPWSLAINSLLLMLYSKLNTIFLAHCSSPYIYLESPLE